MYNSYLLTKGKSVVPNGVSLEFTNHTSGQAACSGVIGQKKTNPMVFFLAFFVSFCFGCNFFCLIGLFLIVLISIFFVCVLWEFSCVCFLGFVTVCF